MHAVIRKGKERLEEKGRMDDMAKEFRSKENYEYDHEKNLLKYYEPITITYQILSLGGKL